jgi:hypothetical protein
MMLEVPVCDREGAARIGASDAGLAVNAAA